MAGFVQKAGSSSPSGASAMSAQNVASVTSPAFGSNTTAGHLLVATGACFQNGTSTPLTFTDSKSNTWGIDVSQFDVGTSDSIGVISSTAIASGKAGSSHTITAQGSGSGSYIEADCIEWDTGSVITVVPLDQTASSGSLTSPTAATTGTTAQAAELVVVCLNCNPSGTNNDVPNAGIGSPPTINGSTTGVTALGLQDLTDTTIGYNAAYYTASSVTTYAVSWTFTQGPDPGGPVGVGGASPLIATYKISSGGGGTENLTEQTATFTEGAPTAGVSYAPTAQTITSSEGTPGANVSYGLTAQTITSSEGSIAPTVTYGLTEQTATFTEGTITAQTGGNITLNLSGQTATFTEGSPAPQVSYGLTAQSATTSEGAPTLGLSYAPSAQTATFTEGTITSQVQGDVTIALAGLQGFFALGQIMASGGDATDTHDPKPWRRKRKFDDSAQTQVIRESALKPKRKPKELPAAQKIAAPHIDGTAEEEDLLRLMSAEDERTFQLIEQAAELLRTLH